jgi:hypothetical protein
VSRNPVTECYTFSSEPSKFSPFYASFSVDVRFEVFTAVAMKNAVFQDLTLCASYKKGRFGGTYRLYHQGDKNRRSRNNISSN